MRDKRLSSLLRHRHLGDARETSAQSYYLGDETLQSSLESSNGHIALMRTTLFRVNQAFENLTGWEPLEEQLRTDNR